MSTSTNLIQIRTLSFIQLCAPRLGRRPTSKKMLMKKPNRRRRPRRSRIASHHLQIPQRTNTLHQRRKRSSRRKRRLPSNSIVSSLWTMQAEMASKRPWSRGSKRGCSRDFRICCLRKKHQKPGQRTLKRTAIVNLWAEVHRKRST